MKKLNKQIKVTKQSQSGRNEMFQVGKRSMSRQTLVQSIENGNHPNYHIRTINGVKTPVSNPDKNANNNLG